MTGNVHIKTLRETVAVINTMIARLQELKETNLSLINQMAPIELPDNGPMPERIYLSPREISVIKLVGQGKSNGEIARALGLKEKYIKNTVSRIYDKLEVNDRGGLVLYALKAGICTINPTTPIKEETKHD